MSKYNKNKNVADRLAENLRKHAWADLRSMLEEYIIKCP